MKPTACHSFKQLTDHVYLTHDTQVVIQPFRKRVYVVSCDVSVNRLQVFQWIILCEVSEAWASLPLNLSFCDVNVNWIQVNEPLEVPEVRLSALFHMHELRAGGMNENQTQYLSVMQGWSGWKAKALFHKAYDELSQFIFYEVMNSYSTVFAGAVTAKALDFDNTRV